MSGIRCLDGCFPSGFQLRMMMKGGMPAWSGSAEEQDHDLCRENSEEHTQWIDRAIAYGRRLFRADAVGIGECGWVGVGSGNHTHDGEIVELELHSGNRTDN